MITFYFNEHSWRIKFPDLNDNLTVEFGLSEINRLVEHEKTISDKNVINKLIESFASDGFLHPILVTEMKNRYVIADGTHRLFALREISLKQGRQVYAPLNILKEPFFKRDSWVFYFNRKIDLQTILDAGFTLTRVNPSNLNEAVARVLNGEFQGLIKSGGEFFSIQREAHTREDFLKSLKELDEILGNYDKLVLREEFNIGTGEMAFIAPPVDDKGDIRILVENSGLRRRKASRTVVKLRPLFLDVPLNILLSDFEDVEKYIIEKIEWLIFNKKILLVKPPVADLDFCGDAFDHPLLIMNKDVFYRKSGFKKSFENQIIEDYKIL
ncbi:MAG: ParB N-terminal domain-containing protein [Candidatus Odinarchaeum yellowstonii]|uniref:ParB N-terminal domain-containing protein n=1 Tax=Odinarchaeota yellowstonii (strain LCB_4) TaxID=1841599 RepID=A0AAF0D1P6_ODILC|nr:MAG: ParB N-terminal domain-containing protein [Candidatus Odinarchaeum yellowstonii]